MDAKLLVLCLLVAGYLEGDAAVGQQERVHRDPLRYVDPNIGGISRLLQAVPPFIQRPHGMVRALPLITPGLTDLDDTLAPWRDAYGTEPFIELSETPVSLRDVLHRNVVRISATLLEGMRTPTLLITSAIDNLVKGAAGQAVQNANLMLGLDEIAGLPA